MDAPTRNYLIRWMMVFAGGSAFLVWAFVLKYLDKRDRRRQQSQ